MLVGVRVRVGVCVCANWRKRLIVFVCRRRMGRAGGGWPETGRPVTMNLIHPGADGFW